MTIDHGAADLPAQPYQRLEHDTFVFGIELARRLVGEDELRATGRRRGDRDALLLPARQLSGTVAAAVLQPEAAPARRPPLPG